MICRLEAYRLFFLLAEWRDDILLSIRCRCHSPLDPHGRKGPGKSSKTSYFPNIPDSHPLGRDHEQYPLQSLPDSKLS